MVNLGQLRLETLVQIGAQLDVISIQQTMHVHILNVKR